MLKKEYKNMLIYLLLGLIVYYVVPFACMLIPENGIKGALFLCLLIVNPLYNFLSSFIYVITNKFNKLFSLLISIIFIPSVFIVYNSSALFYFVFYIILGYIGCFIGSCFKK